MKKKKLIIMIGTFILLCSSLIALAAFVFSRTINGDAKSGKITNLNKYYSSIIYTPYEENDAIDYTNAYILDSNLYQKIDSSTDTTNKIVYKKTEDKFLSTEDKDEGNIKIENEVIKCYATEKRGYSDELPYLYLNQLGISIEFNNEIETYVRIHIEDTWTSRKVYKDGTITSTYVTKDSKIYECFKNDENWKFDSNTGYIYLKKPTSVGKNSYNFNFDANGTYFYQVSQASYRESVIIGLSFKVEIVQKNRAYKIWNIPELEEYLKS